LDGDLEKTQVIDVKRYAQLMMEYDRVVSY
jgi:hypothetical protein